MKKLRSNKCSLNRLAIAAISLLAVIPGARADYQSTVLGDNPLAFYPLNLDVDTGGTASDVSGNSNDGSYVNIFSGYNNATGPSSYITNAINFNGTDTSVDLSSSASLTSLAGAVTLEAWVQPADSTSFGDIIAKGYDSTSYQESYIRVDGPYGSVYDVNLGNAQITAGPQKTNWAHIVLANNGTNTSWYINGVLIQSKPDSVGAISFSDPWAIGNGTSAGNGRHFNGNISQVAFYTNGLTLPQILNHYFVGLVGVTASNSVPIINTQPQAQPGYVGGSATFTVQAVSVLAMTNQWFKNGSPLAGKTNATLTLSNLQLSDAGNYSVVVGNANGTTNSASAALTVAVPNNLEWSGNANSGVWDTGTSANWINLGNASTTVFNSGDTTLFDDAAGAPTTVNVSGTVYPSLITVDSTNNNFSFTGGAIGGSGNLVKRGPSTLNITSAGGFTGTARIEGGTVYAGNNCFNAVTSMTVTNSATLDIGGGTFGSAKPITISGSGVGGIGSIYNSYNDYPLESLSITLTGDAKVGGSARWDLGNGAQISGPYHLTMDWSGGAGYTEWTSVTVGSTVAGITLTNGSFGSKSMDNAFQNPATVFTVSTNCELSFWSGGWNGSLHVMSNATVNLWTAPAAFNGSVITLEDNAQWRSWGSSSTDEPINSAIVLNGVAHCILGDHNLIYTNLVSGSGGILLDYWNHAYVFSSSNTYTGPTIINDGPQVKLTGDGSISRSSLIFFGGNNPTSTHLDASTRSDSTLTLPSGQTLGDIGAVAGNLVESAGATIAPAGTNTTINITTGANPVGAITATGNVALNGTTVIKLGSGTNDSIRAGGSMTLGGTLSLANVSGAPLPAGSTFQIFTAGSSISGSFSSITPATPGSGLQWNTNLLSSGVLGVVATGGPTITNVHYSATGLILSGSGGTSGGTYYVLTATNLLTPMTNWVVWSTNSYDGAGNFNVTNPVSPSTPQQFYRIQQ